MNVKARMHALQIKYHFQVYGLLLYIVILLHLHAYLVLNRSPFFDSFFV